MQKPTTNKNFLQDLIDEHRMKALHVVFKLTFRGKYIIVNGKSLGGSLYFIQLGYSWYRDKVEHPGMLYLHFYRHVKAHPRAKAKLEVLLATSDQYLLLKTAQEAIDKARYSPNFLNNTVEPYIPQYSDLTEEYGWMDKSAVLNFKKWLKTRKRTYRSRSSNTKQRRGPAKRG